MNPQTFRGFVEYVKIRPSNKPLLEKWNIGEIGVAETFIYNSVAGCRDYIKHLEGVYRREPEKLKTLLGCGLALIEHEGQAGNLGKKNLLDAAMKRLDPAHEAAPDKTPRCEKCQKIINPCYTLCYQCNFEGDKKEVPS